MTSDLHYRKRVHAEQSKPRQHGVAERMDYEIRRQFERLTHPRVLVVEGRDEYRLSQSSAEYEFRLRSFWTGREHGDRSGSQA